MRVKRFSLWALDDASVAEWRQSGELSNKLAGDVACLCGSMLEHQPYLLGSRVRFPDGAFATFPTSAKALLPISLSPFPFPLPSTFAWKSLQRSPCINNLDHAWPVFTAWRVTSHAQLSSWWSHHALALWSTHDLCLQHCPSGRIFSIRNNVLFCVLPAGRTRRPTGRTLSKLSLKRYLLICPIKLLAFSGLLLNWFSPSYLDRRSGQLEASSGIAQQTVLERLSTVWVRGCKHANDRVLVAVLCHTLWTQLCFENRKPPELISATGKCRSYCSWESSRWSDWTILANIARWWKCGHKASF